MNSTCGLSFAFNNYEMYSVQMYSLQQTNKFFIVRIPFEVDIGMRSQWMDN